MLSSIVPSNELFRQYSRAPRALLADPPCVTDAISLSFPHFQAVLARDSSNYVLTCLCWNNVGGPMCVLAGGRNIMAKIPLLLTLFVASFVLDATAQSAAPQPAANTAPVNVVLPDGTPVKLRMGATAAANGVRVGQTIELEVAEDVRVGDVVVISKDSPADAEVTNLRSGGNVKGGWIDIDLDSVALSDGQRVPIRASKQRAVRGDQSNIVSSQAQDASISQGADLTAFINGNQPIDLTRLRAASGPTTSIKVTSSPSN